MSFPTATKMFQFAAFASAPYVFRYGYRLKRWVSPFGNPRIKAYSQLPKAYRRVSRPSSPLHAKASTKCPSHARERIIRARGKTPHHRSFHAQGSLPKHRSFLSSREKLIPPSRPTGPENRKTLHNVHQCVTKNHKTNNFFAYPQPANRRSGGAGRDRTDDLMLAKHALSQLSYGPVVLILVKQTKQKKTPAAGLVGPGGLEPPTSRLSGVRSSHLSYEPT